MDQAELIARTIKDLLGDPSPEQREACETQLLCDAPQLTLKDLSRRADRITEIFAPDHAQRRPLRNNRYRADAG